MEARTVTGAPVPNIHKLLHRHLWSSFLKLTLLAGWETLSTAAILMLHLLGSEVMSLHPAAIYHQKSREVSIVSSLGVRALLICLGSIRELVYSLYPWRHGTA